MATKDKDGKLTYHMTSPGEAWNNFVNSKDGHNAQAVTPSYLESKAANQIKPNLYYEAIKSNDNHVKETPKEIDKDVLKDR